MGQINKTTEHRQNLLLTACEKTLLNYTHLYSWENSRLWSIYLQAQAKCLNLREFLPRHSALSIHFYKRNLNVSLKPF